MFHPLKIIFFLFIYAISIERAFANPTAGEEQQQNEPQLKEEVENLQKKIDQQLKLIMEEKLQIAQLKCDQIAKKIDTAPKPFEKQFIQELINEMRPLYVETMRDLLLLWSKVRFISNDPKLKHGVLIADSLHSLDHQVSNIYSNFNNGLNVDLFKECSLKSVHTYHKERTELEGKLKRRQGDEALIEHDQRFVDTLLLNLEQSRDFMFLLFVVAKENMELLMKSSEKDGTKKEYMSIYKQMLL